MTKLLTIPFLLFAIVAYGQASDEYFKELPEEESQVNLGMGLGMDYGGIGLRLCVLPDKYIGLFGGLGYNLHTAGFNVGGQLRLLPDSRVIPVLMGMYGYNGVIVVRGAGQYDKTYYGPSLGLGIEAHSRNGQNFFTVELFLPFRPAEFDRDIDALQANPFIQISKPLPFTFSFGYHFKF
jgi:hypothetical protein